METKLFEVRDRATCMYLSATATLPDNSTEEKILTKAGFDLDYPVVIVHWLEQDEGSWDMYKWQNSRTRFAAINYINLHWDELQNGDVVDVEYILGESTTKKSAEYEEMFY